MSRSEEHKTFFCSNLTIRSKRKVSWCQQVQPHAAVLAINLKCTLCNKYMTTILPHTSPIYVDNLSEFSRGAICSIKSSDRILATHPAATTYSDLTSFGLTCCESFHSNEPRQESTVKMIASEPLYLCWNPL